MSLSTGTKLGQNEIVSMIGAGGMGELYRAQDLRLGLNVAVKILRADLANDADKTGADSKRKPRRLRH